MSAKATENNNSVKALLTNLKKVMRQRGVNHYDYILNDLSGDWIKGYIVQFDNCIEHIQKKISEFMETPNLRLQLNINKSCRASLVYMLNGNKKKSAKFITRYFHLTQECLEVLGDDGYAPRCETTNTIDGNSQFKIDNDQSTRLVQEKYGTDYDLFTLFYKLKFKEEFKLIEYVPLDEGLTQQELYQMELIRKAMFIILMDELNNSYPPTLKKTKKKIKRKTWWEKRFCEDQNERGMKKNFMPTVFGNCDYCDEMYEKQRAWQDDRQLDDDLGYCSKKCLNDNYDEEEKEYEEDQEYKNWLEERKKLEDEDYCAWLEVKQIDCGDDKSREEYNKDWGLDNSREAFKKFMEKAIPNFFEEQQDEVDISGIEDELDNILYQENMNWCYEKPKSGKYQTIYIFKSE